MHLQRPPGAIHGSLLLRCRAPSEGEALLPQLDICCRHRLYPFSHLHAIMRSLYCVSQALGLVPCRPLALHCRRDTQYQLALPLMHNAHS